MKKIFIVFVLTFMMILNYTEPILASDFKDVPSNHWSKPIIDEAVSVGLVEGISDDTFGLNKTVKRSEFAAMLVRLMRWENYPSDYTDFMFSDVSKTDWYYPYVTNLVIHDVYIDKNFRPHDPITRLEMAVMLGNALGYEELCESETDNRFSDVTNDSGYVEVLRTLGIINGKSDTIFDPNGVALREECVAILMRVYNKYDSHLKDIDGFYAISSWSQKEMAKEMDTVSFGWGRLEYADDSVFLNTTNKNGNVWAIPDGYKDALDYMKANNVSTHFSITMTDEDDAKSILLDENNRNEAISKILDYSKDFDGVTIDFETMKGSDLKVSFNEFIKDLKSELGTKKLYVAVHAPIKNSNEYYDAYDYRTLSTYADKIILMAHDYAPTSLPDNILNTSFIATPVTPFEEIYYALKIVTDEKTGVIDKNKVELALSTSSSVAWYTSDKKIIDKTPINPSVDTVMKRLEQPTTEIMYSEKYRNPYAFYYTDDNRQVLLWYEDSRSISDKITLSKMFDVNSISIWRLGAIPDGNASQYMNVWDTILLYK